MICLDKSVANDFINELSELDNSPSWIIGDVLSGERKAKIADDVQIIEI